MNKLKNFIRYIKLSIQKPSKKERVVNSQNYYNFYSSKYSQFFKICGNGEYYVMLIESKQNNKILKELEQSINQFFSNTHYRDINDFISDFRALLDDTTINLLP